MSAGEEWKSAGLCAQIDPERWFLNKGDSTREAKRVCMGCDVRDKCLEYALERDERFGIWGGLSERERIRLKRGEPLETIRARARVVKQIPTKVCQQCGTEFVRHGNAIYCSRTCRDVAYGHTRQEWPKCVVCSKEFAASRAGVKYCSQKCQDRARGRSGRQITVTCQKCGTDFQGYKNHRFCSQTCREAAHRAYHRNYQRQKREAS